MAAPDKLKGLIVEIEDSAGAGTYSAPCAFEGANFNMKNNFAETSLIQDCDTPLGAKQIHRTLLSQDWTLSGQGVLAKGAHVIWEGWRAGGESRSVRIKMMDEDDTVYAHYTSAAVIGGYTLSQGVDDRHVASQVELMADGGAVTYTLGTPA